MPVARELTTTWGFNVDLEPLKKMGEALEGLKGKLLVLAGVEGGAVASVMGFVHFTAEAAEEARRAALTFGLTTDAYQELAYSAKVSGVSQDEMGMALSRMTSLLDEAREGSEEAQKVFWRLGIRPSQMRDTNQAIAAVADHFKSIGDAQRRVALARLVFGRSGPTLIPWLLRGSEGFKELGAEAREFGRVLSEEDIEASHRFTISMDKVWDIVYGLRNIIGVHLIPVVTKLTDGFIEWYRANRQIVQGKVLAFANLLVSALEASWWAVRRLYMTLDSLARPIGGITTLLEAMAIASAVAFGAGMLATIGKVTTALWSLLTVESLDLLPWIALGAIIALIGFAIEDVMTYFTNSGDSVTAMLVSWTKEHLPKVAELLGNIRDLVVALGSYWNDNLKQVIAQVEELYQKYKPLIDLLSTVAGFMAKIMLQDMVNKLNFANAVIPMVTQGLNSYNATRESSPLTSPAGIPGAGSSSSVSTIAPQFNIYANTAADAAAISSSVRDVHREELARLLADAHADVQQQERN